VDPWWRLFFYNFLQESNQIAISDREGGGQADKDTETGREGYIDRQRGRLRQAEKEKDREGD
jgi:hypothetical protein